MKNLIFSLFICIFSSLMWTNNTYSSSYIEKYIYHYLYQNEPTVAFNFLKSLEGMNHAEGLFFLGLFYLNGYGVEKNLPLANQYFLKAGHLGFAPAFKELADSYLSGDGIGKSPDLALYYYEQAAEKGYGPGQFNAGVLLKEGKGLTANPKKAYHWLDLAAQNPDLGDLQQDAKALRDEIKF